MKTFLLCLVFISVGYSQKFKDSSGVLVITPYSYKFSSSLIPNPASNAATPAASGTMTVTMNTSVLTITPTGACTFNASGGIAGNRTTFVVTTSGTSSFVLTFGTNFKAAGTLATGTTTAKVFSVNFICKDGALWVETGRTGAM